MTMRFGTYIAIQDFGLDLGGHFRGSADGKRWAIEIPVVTEDDDIQNDDVLKVFEKFLDSRRIKFTTSFVNRLQNGGHGAREDRVRYEMKR